MNQKLKSFLKKIWKNYRRIRYGFGYKTFGEGSIVRKPMRAVGRKHISVGRDVDIMNGLRIEAVTKWGTGGYEPAIILMDHVTIGQNCHITCANRIEIHEGTNIMPDVLITDIEHGYEQGKSSMDTPINAGKVYIGKNVTVGMGARILGHRGIEIGDNAVIGANAVVVKNVKACTVVGGIPAKIIGRI